MKWKETNKNEYPDINLFPNRLYDIPCLVHSKYGFMILWWNAEYKCWDNEQGDDYYCDKELIDKWEYLDKIINYLDAEDKEKI